MRRSLNAIMIASTVVTTNKGVATKKIEVTKKEIMIGVKVAIRKAARMISVGMIEVHAILTDRRIMTTLIQKRSILTPTIGATTATIQNSS